MTDYMMFNNLIGKTFLHTVIPQIYKHMNQRINMSINYRQFSKVDRLFWKFRLTCV